MQGACVAEEQEGCEKDARENLLVGGVGADGSPVGGGTGITFFVEKEHLASSPM